MTRAFWEMTHKLVANTLLVICYPTPLRGYAQAFFNYTADKAGFQR